MARGAQSTGTLGAGEAVGVEVAVRAARVLVPVGSGADEGIDVDIRVETGVAAGVGLGVGVQAVTHISAPQMPTNSRAKCDIPHPACAAGNGGCQEPCPSHWAELKPDSSIGQPVNRQVPCGLPEGYRDCGQEWLDWKAAGWRSAI
jgi:hypothetical protein